MAPKRLVTMESGSDRIDSGSTKVPHRRVGIFLFVPNRVVCDLHIARRTDLEFRAGALAIADFGVKVRTFHPSLVMQGKGRRIEVPLRSLRCRKQGFRETRVIFASWFRSNIYPGNTARAIYHSRNLCSPSYGSISQGNLRACEIEFEGETPLDYGPVRQTESLTYALCVSAEWHTKTFGAQFWVPIYIGNPNGKLLVAVGGGVCLKHSVLSN